MVALDRRSMPHLSITAGQLEPSEMTRFWRMRSSDGHFQRSAVNLITISRETTMKKIAHIGFSSYLQLLHLKTEQSTFQFDIPKRHNSERPERVAVPDRLQCWADQLRNRC